MTCLILICGLSSLSLISACARQSPQAVENLRESRYALTGEIVDTDSLHSRLIVRHDEIKDFMPAMTMEFQVGAGDLANAKPGQRIRGELVVPQEGEMRLENIWPDEKVLRDSLTEGERSLREDTALRGRSAYREVGEAIPSFVLLNQNGEMVSIHRFKGKRVMLNFIYTRCPIPDMCPLATTKMLQTQKLAAEAGLEDFVLVSISLDPAHDTPGVLRAYAEQKGISGNFSLLTGPEPAVKDLLTQFGILVKLEGGLVKHTLATLLIDEQGRILHRADGNVWEPRDFVAKLRR